MTRALALLTLLAACAAAPRGPSVAPGEVATDAEGRCWAGTAGAARGEAATFEALCPDALSPDFVSSLQRALAARGLYHGAADGLPGPELSRAIQDFQSPLGLDSPVLSLRAARDLGLVPLSREEIARL